MHSLLRSAFEQWGKSTGQTTNFPVAFTTVALRGFTQYNETGNATGNADQTVTGLSKTSITTYRGCGYNYWVIGYQPQWGYWAKIPSTTHIWIYPVPVNAIYGLFAQREKDSTSINIEGSLIRRKSLIDCDINFAAGTSDPNAGFAILIAS